MDLTVKICQCVRGRHFGWERSLWFILSSAGRKKQTSDTKHVFDFPASEVNEILCQTIPLRNVCVCVCGLICAASWKSVWSQSCWSWSGSRDWIVCVMALCFAKSAAAGDKVRNSHTSLQGTRVGRDSRSSTFLSAHISTKFPQIPSSFFIVLKTSGFCFCFLLKKKKKSSNS